MVTIGCTVTGDVGRGEVLAYDYDIWSRDWAVTVRWEDGSTTKVARHKVEPETRQS